MLYPDSPPPKAPAVLGHTNPTAPRPSNQSVALPSHALSRRADSTHDLPRADLCRPDGGGRKPFELGVAGAFPQQRETSRGRAVVAVAVLPHPSHEMSNDVTRQSVAFTGSVEAGGKFI